MKIRFPTRTLALTALPFLMHPLGGQVPLDGFRNAEDMLQIQETFPSPPLDYAPHAFWFWNDELDESVSTHMAREMSRKGMNPGYAHPRHIGSGQGLPVDQWLSPEYFDCFQQVLEVCETEGTLFGFCDEYWWPSGRMGGRMVAEHPEMQARELTWELTAKQGPWTYYLPPNKFIVACQHGERGIILEDTLQLISTGETGIWEIPEGKWFLYIFNVVPSPSRVRGPDQVLVNYMQPDLAEKMISMGLEPYAEHLGEYMGNALRYCFSDNEGEYGNVLPWSDFMVEFSRELYGEDIRRLMPLLLTEDRGGSWVSARYKWFNLIAEIYAHKFWKPINDWLAGRGLFYVSNFWENNLMLQAATVGDYFRVNRAFSLPGNDALMMGAFNVLNFKEIQSICELEQRPFMSEIMGVQGWGQTPSEMKKVANLATAWGVTQIVPHGVNLDQDLSRTIHPADWFEQNPYWETMECWTDFCRRASYINSQGQLEAPVLIYNPMTSIWALSESFLAGRSGRGNWDDPRAQRINRAYFSAQATLSKANIEYLLADDTYVLQSIVDKEAKELELLEHRFSTLILPPMFAVQTDVYRRMVSFAKAGGRVILMGSLPVASVESGLKDPAILQLNRELRSCLSVEDVGDAQKDINDICREVAEKISPPFSFVDSPMELHSSHRIVGGNHFYWLSNNTDKQQSGTLVFPSGSGRAEIWDCETGSIRPVHSESSPSGQSVFLEFEPDAGFWLVFNEGEQPVTASPQIKTREILTIPADSWQITLESREVPVTTAGVWIEDDQPVSHPDEIPSDRFSKQSILAPFQYLGQWTAEWITAPVRDIYGYAIYEFSLEETATSGLLSLTADGGMALFVNGQEIADLPNRNSWKVPDTIDLLPYLKKGLNRIAVRAGKNLRPGTFWMLAQGDIVTNSGKHVTILSSSGWFMTNSSSPDPDEAMASRSGWTPVNKRGWNQLSWTGRTDVLPPASRLIKGSELWLKFDIPPGATRFNAGIDLSGTETWLDSTPVKPGGNTVDLNEGSSTLHIKTTSKAMDSWTRPGSFICNKSERGRSGSWSDWGMDRYSGFVRYSNKFIWKPVKTDEQVLLDLGRVDFVAQVLVNGNPVGKRMWAPFRFDITDFLKDGSNVITVRTGNLITNRMAVYEDLHQLSTWGNPGRPGKELFSGGLFGPVRILAE